MGTVRKRIITVALAIAVVAGLATAGLAIAERVLYGHVGTRPAGGADLATVQAGQTAQGASPAALAAALADGAQAACTQGGLAAQEVAHAYRFAVEDANPLRIPDSGTALAPFTFNATYPASTDTLTAQQRRGIRQALEAIEDTGADVAFVFFDFSTGHGLAYNAHQEMYPASSIKAPVSFYVLSAAAESENGLSSADARNMESVLRHSDNSAYDALYARHMDADFFTWMEEHGIDASHARANYYPDICAAQLACFWFEIYDFLADEDVLVGEEALAKDEGEETDAPAGKTDEEEAPEAGSPAWLAGLLCDTNVSFIRDGVGEWAHVYNKAGWIAGSSDNSTTDAGLVLHDGETYLMAIMTNQPSSQAAGERVADLALALLDARLALK